MATAPVFSPALTAAPPERGVEEDWDAIVIGGGPGGLTAAIYLVRFGARVLVVEREALGGRVTLNPLVENYPPFVEISGEDLARRFASHAKSAGVEFLFPDEVVGLRADSGRFVAVTKSGRTLSSRVVIIGTGAEERELGVPGERELYGRGVSYCAVCDGPLFRGKAVAVVGGGETAAISGIHLAGLASKVYLIHRRDRMRANEARVRRLLSLPNVEAVWNTVVERIIGDERVEGVILRDLKTGETREVAVDGVFIFVGVRPVSGLARSLGVRTDERGFILVDARQRTSVPRVYAVGDVVGYPMQISKAVGDGTRAAVDAFEEVLGGPYGGAEEVDRRWREEWEPFDLRRR